MPLVYKFAKRSVQNQEESAQKGHPVFDDKDYIQILVPGDANSKVDREIRAADLQNPEIAKLYEHWKRGLEAPLTGTPLEQWPVVNAAQVDTLRVVNIRTVEQLAEVSDQNVTHLGMGYDTLRKQAANWLAAAKDASHLTKMQAQHDELQAQYEATRRQLDEVMAELRQLKSTAAHGDERLVRSAKRA